MPEGPVTTCLGPLTAGASNDLRKGITQTQTLTETFGALTQATEGADDARGCSLGILGIHRSP